MHSDIIKSERLLRMPEVVAHVGIGRSAIYQGVKAGTFPKPVKISSQVSAWVGSEIDQWVHERIAAGRQR